MSEEASMLKVVLQGRGKKRTLLKLQGLDERQLRRVRGGDGDQTQTPPPVSSGKRIGSLW
jgi:hypothetical protein